jgi:hypothetical protein
MNAIVSWVTTVTPPLTSLTGKRVGLFLLGMVLIGLAVAGFMRPAKTAPNPALLAERGEANPALAHHAPGPGINQESITLSRPLPATTAIPIATPAAPDPLLFEHSKKLADLNTVVTQVRGDIAGMANRLDGFQTELHGIKQQLAKRSALPQGIHTRQHNRPDAVKVRQRRLRAKANNPTVSSPKATSANGLQVVAVNNWGTESRIIVREPNSKQYRQLRVGDPLSGGTIVSMNAHKVTIRNAYGTATVDLGKGRP